MSSSGFKNGTLASDTWRPRAHDALSKLQAKHTRTYGNGECAAGPALESQQDARELSSGVAGLAPDPIGSEGWVVQEYTKNKITEKN